MNKWSDIEVQKLKKLYPFVNNSVIAKILNRSVTSITKKALASGFKKDKEVQSAVKSIDREGDKSTSWNGGRKKTVKGYIAVLDKANPDSDINGYVLEHRKIMSEHLGRRLNNQEAVHHINGNKEDNRIDNLEVVSWRDHTILHHTGLKRTEKTKAKLSQKAKERLANEENHPLYKDINTEELLNKRDSGMTVKEICNHYEISKRTYYNKLGR